MHKLLFTLITGLTAVVIASGCYLIYMQNENIKLYATQLIGTKQDYKKLAAEYNQMKQSMGNTNQSSSSRKIAVSNAISNYTKQVEGNVSVYYKNLTGGETITRDPDKKYYMASLYKVILVLYMLDEIKSGNASLTDRVGTSSATLDVAIDKIITESNNEYAQTLAEQYGWKNIEKKMKPKLGIDFSFNDDLQISVRDMGRLFEEIAYSLTLSDKDSSYILKLLSNQVKTSKLPKYLPESIYAHNKTGEFEDYSHDAGIFYTPRANYILIFMSKSENPKATDEIMANMSKEIYEILNKN